MTLTNNTYENINVFPFESSIDSNAHMEGVVSDKNMMGFYVYKIESGDMSHLGMIASINAQSTIKPHEKVLPEKVSKYIQRLNLTGTQSNPVMLIHRNESLQTILESVANTKDEDASYTLSGQVHKIWKVAETDLIDRIQEQCQRIEEFYIADGHHRVSALQQSMTSKKRAIPPRLLGAVFSHTQVNIDAFNRGCLDLNGLSTEQFLDELSETFFVTPMPEFIEPDKEGEFGMFLQGKWYLLTVLDEINFIPQSAHSTAVEQLEELVFAKYLGIKNTSQNQRIAFIDGSKKQQSFEVFCRDKGIKVAFTFKAISPRELMQKIDHSQTLPPHSTWFSPKVLPDILCLKTDVHKSEMTKASISESSIQIAS